MFISLFLFFVEGFTTTIAVSFFIESHSKINYKLKLSFLIKNIKIFKFGINKKTWFY